jgi:arginine repressor
MARNNREQREIEYRRQCVKDTWIKLGAFDVTQEQITQALKADFGIEVDRSTVSRDLAAIKKMMSAETAEELKAFLLAEYLFVIKEERAAWKRSLEDAVIEISEMTELPGMIKDEKGTTAQVVSQRLKASTRRAGQSGNPAHMAQLQAALRSIWELIVMSELEARVAAMEAALENKQ